MNKNKKHSTPPENPHKKTENIQDHLSSNQARRETIESCRAKLKIISQELKKRKEEKRKTQ